MSRRRIYGPTAFLVTLGLVVLFLGILVFLAIPAASILDEKDREYKPDVKLNSRADKVKLNSIATVATGGGIITLGLVLGWRKTRQNRSS